MCISVSYDLSLCSQNRSHPEDDFGKVWYDSQSCESLCFFYAFLMKTNHLALSSSMNMENYCTTYIKWCMLHVLDIVLTSLKYI